MYRNIARVLPSIFRHPRVLYADTERQLRCVYQMSKSCIMTINSLFCLSISYQTPFSFDIQYYTRLLMVCFVYRYRIELHSRSISNTTQLQYITCDHVTSILYTLLDFVMNIYCACDNWISRRSYSFNRPTLGSGHGANEPHFCPAQRLAHLVVAARFSVHRTFRLAEGRRDI